MKKLLWIGPLLFLGAMPIFSTAQKISIGGGMPYNVTVEAPGLNLRGYYNVNESFCFGPEFTFFFPGTESKAEEEIEKSIWEINLNAHYVFELNEQLGVYPILGFNYTREKEDINYAFTNEKATKTKEAFGLNLGGGFHVPLPQFTPFVEYEYVVSSLSEHIITVGVFFNIGGANKETEIE